MTDLTPDELTLTNLCIQSKEAFEAASETMDRARGTMRSAYEALSRHILINHGLKPNTRVVLCDPFYSRMMQNNPGETDLTLSQVVYVDAAYRKEDGEVRFTITDRIAPSEAPLAKRVGGITLVEIQIMRAAYLDQQEHTHDE